MNKVAQRSELYPEMLGSKAKKPEGKPIKVSLQALHWLKDEQTRYRHRGDAEPSYEELIDLLIEHYGQTRGVTSVAVKISGIEIPQSMIPLVKWFIRWFKTKHDPMVEARKAEMAHMAEIEDNERT